jgi:hypothetical protein
MPPFVLGVELVDQGTGTLKYLVAETGRDPFVAQNIHELLDDVDDFDSTDVQLITVNMRTFLVHVAMGDHEDDWWVSLGEEPGGENIEHIVYADPGPDAAATDRHNVQLHEQWANGWPDPTN